MRCRWGGLGNGKGVETLFGLFYDGFDGGKVLMDG